MTDFLPWTEKYRPKVLSEIIGQGQIVESLKSFVKEKNMPSLLFAGPPGCGKTTATLALAHELYGDSYRGSVLELNASVTPETPILIREKGEVLRTTFAYLAKKYYGDGCEDSRREINGIEILSVDREHKVHFLPATKIFRHRKSEVVSIRYEGGAVRTSLDHSVIVLDGSAEMVSKKAGELRAGDFLITFAKEIDGRRQNIDLSDYAPQTHNLLRSGVVRNPKTGHVFEQKELNEQTAWMMGLYLAEGCLSFRNGTSGQIIFTVGYPQEMNIVNSLEETFEGEFGLRGSTVFGKSGFDRTRTSSIQFRVMNTQLAAYFAEKFYDGTRKYARTKRIPSSVFSSDLPVRIRFLQGYMGDATGEWGKCVRYASKSKSNLIDVAWLGRICGISTSIFKDEVRAVWKLPSYSYIRTELLPAEPLIRIVKGLQNKNPKYFLRHQLYSKRSKRLSKSMIKEFAARYGKEVKGEANRKILANLLKLADSPLSVVMVKKTEVENYDGYVYDVSVPGSETFFGGTAPVLLHNSDERGIDIVRGAIKDFARTVAITGTPFKIIFLDEADALTPDAQHALRRTMEMYATVTRFILSCNYSSKIIEPIQSRCSVFRFKPLAEQEVLAIIDMVAEREGLKIGKEAKEAVVYLSEGDMRKATNILQGCAIHSKTITADSVYKSTSRAKPVEVKQMLDFAYEGKFMPARKKLEELMATYGMSAEDVMGAVYKEVQSLEIPDLKKVEIIDSLGEMNFRVVEGANERIQLEALLARIMLIGAGK
ncbi:replication factor C small subunit [Candidatus Parvarchaeota archaeon]|nr:replication factor C small subunit [Candidatus Parvarchaeota archaeon]